MFVPLRSTPVHDPRMQTYMYVCHMHRTALQCIYCTYTCTSTSIYYLAFTDSKCYTVIVVIFFLWYTIILAGAITLGLLLHSDVKNVQWPV